MKKLFGVILLASFAAIALAIFSFGWPRTYSDAGGLAAFVGTLLTPVSLILLVLTLATQEHAQQQAVQDDIHALQVRALIALIEDDARTLDGMSERGEETAAFYRVQRRYRQRIDKLKDLMEQELHLSAMADEPDPVGGG
jgi:hypothetical protein